jgi:hypothetical protein
MPWPSESGVAAGQRITSAKMLEIVRAFPEWKDDVDAGGYELKFLGNAPAKASDYDFDPIQPGGTLTGGAPATVTIPNVPPGMNGSNSGYWVYISGGTGTPEAVLVTGGSAVSGGAGTLQFTPANNHSGAWTISSATGGIQEAIVSVGGDIHLQDDVTLYGPVVFPAPVADKNVRLIGKGRRRSYITVDPSLPTTVDGVFQFPTTEPGPALEGFSVYFDQPDSSDIGDYTEWPPFVYANNCPRFEIRDIMVCRAWDGIVMAGNCGGAIISGLHMSAFGAGIDIDGSIDTVRIDGLHFWPFGLTSTQTALFLSDTSIIGTKVGRMDDLKLTKCLWINQKAVVAYESASGTPGIQFSNCSLDTSANVRVEAGTVTIDNSYFSMGLSSQESVTITGGVVTITDNIFYNSSGGGGVFGSPRRCIYAPLAGNSQMIIANNRFHRAVADDTAPPVVEIVTGASAAAMVSMNGNQFYMAAPAWANPIVLLNNTTGSGRLTFIGNRILDQLGTTKFLKINADDYHFVWGNTFLGSISDFPATKAAGIYQDDTRSVLHLITLVGTPTYADNTAATGAGLTGGMVYKTSTGQLMQVF